MAKTSWLSWVMLAGTVASEFALAYEDDQKIDEEEAFAIIEKLAAAAGMTFDSTYATLVLRIITMFRSAAEDGIVSLAEIIEMARVGAEAMGVELDVVGIEI